LGLFDSLKKQKEPAKKRSLPYGGFESAGFRPEGNGPSVGAKPSYRLSLDNAIKRNAKRDAQEENAVKHKTGNFMASIGAGYNKFQKGKKQFNGILNDLGSLIPEQSTPRARKSSRSRSTGRRKSSAGQGFDFDFDINAMIGNPYGGQTRRKSSGSKRGSSPKGHLPIYRGNKIVGYVAKGGTRKKKENKDPFDFGF
jgi:hypothetical protein